MSDGKKDEIKIEVRDRVAYVRLNRPEKRNALTREMLERLSSFFAEADARADVRAVILSGEGEAFCAGTDVAELKNLDEEEALRASERGQSVCELIELCRVPVVCAVEGAAAGGGFELALACHLRVASRTARFSLPELKLGAVPAYGGTQRLARDLGRARALEAMLAGEGLGCEEAYARGLVNRVAAPGEALREAEKLAREIEAHSAPLAARACIEAVTRGARLSHVEALALEAELFSRLFSTGDAREGTRAFLEKRRPEFKGV